jgi:serine/threonine protein kinase
MPADAPQGICPECLLKAGFASGSGTGAGNPAFTPLSIAAVGKFFPQLEILELIGKGGMGAVYKARQAALDRLVALKMLPPRSGSDADFAARFTREARALAKLSHPNIIAVYEFGQVEGLHYLIMEYVDGPNLRQIEQAGTLSPRQALEIIPQICEALQFAHDSGVVHRDIKPENVLLDKKGRVRIADFGLAKILGRTPEDLRLTGARDVMGTPHYMAPEQVEKPQEVDHRADIYSLGVVFYEMLTGELPLGKFPLPSSKAPVNRDWDNVILRALEKEPARRFQRASEVKTRVETISQKRGPRGHSEKCSASQSLFGSKVFWAAAMVAAAFVIVGGIFLQRARSTSGKPMGLLKNLVTTQVQETSASAGSTSGADSYLDELDSSLREAIAGPRDQVFDRLRTIAGSVPAKNAAAALDRARNILLDPAQWEMFAMTLLPAWAEVNPEAAADYARDNFMVMQNPPGRFGDSSVQLESRELSAVLTIWGKKDLDAALAWTGKLPDNLARDFCLVSALIGCIQADPQKAMATLNGFSAQQCADVRTALRVSQSVPPAAAVQLLSALPTGFNRDDGPIYWQLAERWARQDLNAAVAWAKNLPSGAGRENALMGVLNQWMQQDPAAATDFAMNMPVGTLRDHILQQVIAVKMETDPQGAADFVMSLPASGSRKDLLKNTMALWARQDPASAIQYANAMPAGASRKEVYWYIGYNWALNDPEAAWKWALSLPVEDGDTRIGSAAAVVRAISSRSPQDAADYVAQLTGSDYAFAVRALVGETAPANPTWTASWVQGIPAGDARNRAVENLVKSWADKDPVAASDWLNEQPQDAGFQNAARQMVPRAMKVSPDLAWFWALKLADPKLRDQQIQNVARQWIGMDPDTARTKIQASGLPADTISKLIEASR